MNELTLAGEMNRLRDEGYTADFYATEDGRLACPVCNDDEDPAEVQIDHTIRFEGESNPDDAAILLAIQCRCGCKGQYTSAYGEAASRNDAKVLRALAEAQRNR